MKKTKHFLTSMILLAFLFAAGCEMNPFGMEGGSSGTGGTGDNGPSASPAPYVTPVEDLEYTVENGEVTITGYKGSDSDLVIPSEIEGLPVVTIGSRAFITNYTLHSVILPDTLRVIEASAFHKCESLVSIRLSDSLESIGQAAFLFCYSLISLDLPDTLSAIGDIAFSDCTSLVSINAGEGSQFFSSYEGVLFNKDRTSLLVYPAGKALRDYRVPYGVERIGDFAFRGAVLLEKLTFPESVTSLGDEFVQYCTKLMEVFFLGGTPPFRASFSFNYNSIDYKIIVPSANLDVYRDAWKSDVPATAILPLLDRDPIVFFESPFNGSVGSMAAVSGSPDSEIALPACGFTRQGYQFVGWAEEALGVVIAEEGGSLPLYHFDRTLYACWLSDTASPGSDFHFVQSITYPDELGISMYNGSDSHIYIPEYYEGMPVKKWDGSYIFNKYNNTATHIYLPETMNYVGGRSFSNSRNLEYLFLPASIRSVLSFRYCNNLESIVLMAETPPFFEDNALENCPIASIFVPAGSVDAYKAAEGWSDYADAIVAQ